MIIPNAGFPVLLRENGNAFVVFFIADCFYFGAAEILSKDSALFLLVAVAGNTLGALLTAALEGRRQQPVPENEKT